MMNVHLFIKLAGIKRTRKEIKAHWDNINPSGVGADLFEDDPLPEFKRAYRENIRTAQNPEVPFKVRAESFRHFKKTGKLPALTMNYDEATGKHTFRVHRDAKGNPTRSIAHSLSKEPITMYHGGDVKRIPKSLKNPRAQYNEVFIRPGATRFARNVLWVSPDKSTADAYARAGRTLKHGSYGKNEAAPARLTVTAPRNRFLHYSHYGLDKPSTEATLDRSSLKRALKKIRRLK